MRTLLLSCLLALGLSAQENGFVPNAGQWQGDFDFRLRDPQGMVFIKATEHSVSLIAPQHVDHKLHHHHSYIHKGHTYRIKWLGANKEAEYTVKKLGNSPKLNYLLGNDPDKWASGLKQYRELIYHDVYPGIDLRYYLTSLGVCAFDFIVNLGADPQQIRWQIEGVAQQGLLSGDLVLITSIGSAVYSAPQSFQNKELIGSAFQQYEDQTYGFNLDDYDQDEVLIIDPTLVFSTYSGSTDDNFGFSATFAEDGSAYGAGITYGYGNIHRAYPTSLGAFQDSSQGGLVDVTISKYTADGTSQIYATYMGGSGNEAPFSLLEGPNKSLIILGAAGSPDFPVHPNGYDTSFAKGSLDNLIVGGQIRFNHSSDIFVCILDSTGGNLLGGTFFGDTMSDGNNKKIVFNYGDPARGDITLDAQGNIIISSYTFSPNLPVGAATNSNYNGEQDGLIVSFSPDLRQLNWARYLGGSKDDASLSLRFTNQDRLYVTGTTDSDSLQYDTTDVYQSFNKGKADAFLAELDPSNGDVLAWTYSGTAEEDRAFFVDYTPDGNLVLFGQTSGPWPWVGDSVWGVQGSSQFLQEFTPDLKRVIHSTTFGDGLLGVTDISPTALMVSNCGDIFLSGWGAAYLNSSRALMGDTRGLPVTSDAFRDSSDLGDFYFLRLDASWTRLEYATFFGQWQSGRDHVDGGSSRFRRDGSIFQAVCSCGPPNGFPITANAYSDTNRSNNCNMAVFRFDMEADTILCRPGIAPGFNDSTCLPASVQFVDNSFNADFTLVLDPDGNLDTLGTQIFTVQDSGLSIFKFFAIDTNCNLIDSAEVFVYGFNRPLDADFAYDYDSCDGTGIVNFLNVSEGASVYRWDFGDGNTSSLSSPSHSYLPGNYTVQLIAEDPLCQQIDTLEQEIEIVFRGSEVEMFTSSDACDPERRLRAEIDQSRISPSDFQRIEWYIDDELVATSDSLNYNLDRGGWFELKLLYKDTICNRELEFVEEVFFYDEDFSIEFPNVFTPNGDGINDEFTAIEVERVVPFLSRGDLQVFNRHGQLIFSKSIMEGGWNGQNEGLDLPEGVFYYLFNYEDICGQGKEQKGFLHLER